MPRLWHVLLPSSLILTVNFCDLPALVCWPQNSNKKKKQWRACVWIELHLIENSTFTKLICSIFKYCFLRDKSKIHAIEKVKRIQKLNRKNLVIHYFKSSRFLGGELKRVKPNLFVRENSTPLGGTARGAWAGNIHSNWDNEDRGAVRFKGSH